MWAWDACANNLFISEILGTNPMLVAVKLGKGVN